MEDIITKFLTLSGSGYGYGSGYGDGDGDGYGDGDGIKSINSHIVYNIDNTPTIISYIRGNIAKGYILMDDLSLAPCYIVKEDNRFAHGQTLSEAMLALQEKLYDTSTEQERIAKFVAQFPDIDTPYSALELFTWHHILTGSCRMGRKVFCANNKIDIHTDTFTIRQFIELTQNQYNGHIIKKLEIQYENNQTPTSN